MGDLVAEIPMRSPNGKSTWIKVYRTEKGADVIFGRTSEGECLVMLPGHAVVSLAQALTIAVSPTECGGASQ